jgi:hypothetical protein
MSNYYRVLVRRLREHLLKGLREGLWEGLRARPPGDATIGRASRDAYNSANAKYEARQDSESGLCWTSTRPVC